MFFGMEGITADLRQKLWTGFEELRRGDTGSQQDILDLALVPAVHLRDNVLHVVLDLTGGEMVFVHMHHASSTCILVVATGWCRFSLRVADGLQLV